MRHVGYLQELYRDARSTEHKILRFFSYHSGNYEFCIIPGYNTLYSGRDLPPFGGNKLPGVKKRNYPLSKCPPNYKKSQPTRQ